MIVFIKTDSGQTQGNDSKQARRFFAGRAGISGDGAGKACRSGRGRESKALVDRSGRFERDVPAGM